VGVGLGLCVCMCLRPPHGRSQESCCSARRCHWLVRATLALPSLPLTVQGDLEDPAGWRRGVDPGAPSGGSLSVNFAVKVTVPPGAPSDTPVTPVSTLGACVCATSTDSLGVVTEDNESAMVDAQDDILNHPELWACPSFM
jgi:hypothetical protein